MIEAPPKNPKVVRVSDFEFTQNQLKSTATLEKKASMSSWDSVPTPKKSGMFLPLRDRTLRRYEFREVKNNRAKLIDWLLQIVATFENGWECYQMTIELLDSLIADLHYARLENLHLTSMVACFIVSKFIGRNPITVRHVVIGMSHRKFSEGQIINEQEQILKLIFEKSNFERNNIFSYLMEKYSDFPQPKLTEAMKMLTLAMMRPDIAFEAMKVRTYKELVDRMMREVSYGKGGPFSTQSRLR